MTEPGFEALHVERTGSFTLPLPRHKAFPFFTPEGERAWVPGWSPEYLHPRTPSAAPGTAFRTHHNNEETHWLVMECDPASGIAVYARFAANRMGTVRVSCTGDGPAETRVTVSYSLTALDQRGNAVLEQLTSQAYEAMLADWEQMIRKAL